MNIYKRIISLSVAFAMCISLMIAPASATELVPSGQYQLTNYSRAFALGAVSDLSLDYIQNIGGYLSTLWEAMKTGSCDGCSANPADGRHNFLPRDGYMITWEAGLKGNAACDCQYCGITFDEFWNSTYNQYVSSLPGSVVNSDGSFLIPVPLVSTDNGVTDPVAWPPHYTISISGNAYSAVGTFCGTGNSLNLYYGSVYAPCNGYYTWIHDYVRTGSVIFGSQVFSYKGRDHVIAGTDLVGSGPVSGLIQIYGNSDVASSVRGSVWYKCEPDVPLSDDSFPVSSRPTFISGYYGVRDSGGSISSVSSGHIVNETDKTVYNPATDTTISYTDFIYDYSDRSYTLTLEDGSSMKVVYGDESVTIQEGDVTYNVYYMIPNDTGSGDDSGDTPGTDDPVVPSGFWDWWKNAWTSFTDKLFSVIGSGSSSVNPETAPAVPDDEETGEKGYNVIDLFFVLKDGTWAFITGIVSTAYDGFTGFVESVLSAGSFFTFYNEDSENSLVFIPLEEGGSVWD